MIHVVLLLLLASTPERVTICHRTSEGTYHLIEIAASAEAVHRAHGDGRPGDLIPGREPLRFSATCRIDP